MEVLSHDVVELILERVPVKSLVRLKSVSKQWKSTIESNNFRKRQLDHRQQSRGPDVLFVCDDNDYDHNKYIPSSSLSLSLSSVIPIIFPIKEWFGCSASCDGLVCIYNSYKSITVFNPTTRWHRTLPPSTSQPPDYPKLGFGKDKVNGTYKPVWLYNNDSYNKIKTTCEVFDFSLDSWRYVTHASPYGIISYIDPVNLDGSLHWLTKRELGIVEGLSLDLHTETFQVIAKTPFANPHHYKMNNCLCLSVTNWPNQVLWLFDSGRKTWNHMHSIDLEITYCSFSTSTIHENKWCSGIDSLKPLAVLEEKNKKTKKKKVLLNASNNHLLIYDHQRKSYELAFTFESFGYPVCYFQSLISIL